MGINNKYDNLKTQFIYKSGLLSYYVAERLNNNQKIKRLLKYQTINPLSDKGLTKDNRIVEQPDIEENLLDVNIFDGMFNQFMEELHTCQIYIHTYRGRNDYDWGEIYIAINILIPLTFEKLVNFGEKRSFVIASEIENMFQDICVDNDNADKYLVDKLGNLKFVITQFDNSRLSKTNNIVLNTIILKTGVSTRRISE